jgi:hypothetical protein
MGNIFGEIKKYLLKLLRFTNDKNKKNKKIV